MMRVCVGAIPRVRRAPLPLIRLVMLGTLALSVAVAWGDESIATLCGPYVIEAGERLYIVAAHDVVNGTLVGQCFTDYRPEQPLGASCSSNFDASVGVGQGCVDGVVTMLGGRYRGSYTCGSDVSDIRGELILRRTISNGQVTTSMHGVCEYGP